MHRMVIGWVIYVRRHCHRAKLFHPVSAANRTKVTGSTGKHATMSLYAVKAGLLSDIVEEDYMPRPCDFVCLI